MEMSGSPPRVREKHNIFFHNNNIVRITPACAGKTSIKTLPLKVGWDHPRVCGKNIQTERTNKVSPGSPPRVREKPSPSTVI